MVQRRAHFASNALSPSSGPLHPRLRDAVRRDSEMPGGEDPFPPLGEGGSAAGSHPRAVPGSVGWGPEKGMGAYKPEGGGLQGRLLRSALSKALSGKREVMTRAQEEAERAAAAEVSGTGRRPGRSA